MRNPEYKNLSESEKIKGAVGLGIMFLLTFPPAAILITLILR